MAMRRSVIGLAILILFLAPSLLNAGPQADPAFRTVHLFDLSSTQEETRLLAVLDEFNQLFSRLGYSEVRYRLWKIQEKGSDQFTYLYDSTWPDKATYDKVHQNSDYKTILEKHLPFFQKVLENEIYTKYVELSTGEKGL